MNLKERISAHFDTRSGILSYTDDPLRPFEERLLMGFHQGFVLDDCCGGGRVSWILSRRGMNVTGIDFSWALVREANEAAHTKQLPVAFVYGDASSLPFSDSSFDYAICFGSLIYQSSGARRQQAIDELARIVRPGGAVIITVSSPLYPGKWALRWFGLLGNAVVSPMLRDFTWGDVYWPWRRLLKSRPPYVHHWTNGELRMRLSAAGLRPWLEQDRTLFPNEIGAIAYK